MKCLPEVEEMPWGSLQTTLCNTGSWEELALGPGCRGRPSTPGPALRVTPRELKSHLLLGSQPGGPQDHEPMQTSTENRTPSPPPQAYGVLTTAKRLPSPSQAAPTGT